jgi:hypothetical protein
MVTVIAAASGSLEARQKFPPDKFANLQIFPKEASPAVVINAMKGFTRALGVRCQFCHVGEEGMPLEKFDFVADTKPEKQTARMMIRMVGEINAQLTNAMPDAPAMGYQVTCFTCHRGAQHPQHAPDAPDAPKPPGR